MQLNMTMLHEILEFNRTFVERREYEPLLTNRFPDKRLVVVGCMDTRLVELLPRAMNVRNGDAKLIKVAGAVVAHPYGSVMRSILLAVFTLGADEVMIVGHHGCGLTGLSRDRFLESARGRGVTEETFEQIRSSGVDLDRWMTGFQTPESGVRESVALVQRHPLMPASVPVHGLMMHPETGQLDVLVDGYVATMRA